MRGKGLGQEKVGKNLTPGIKAVPASAFGFSKNGSLREIRVQKKVD